MGAENSSMSSSNASSRESYSATGESPSMAPPHLMRRMSQGVGSTFPSLKMADTMIPQHASNPASLQPGYQESMASSQETERDIASDKSKASSSTSDIPQPWSSIPQPLPPATLDDFAPGDHSKQHQPAVTWMTHPWHKPGSKPSSSPAQQKESNGASRPLAQNVASFSKKVLGMADDDAISKSAASSSSYGSTTSASSGKQPFMSSTLATTSPVRPQRRMSTGSMLPPKDNPFDAEPDALHREMRLAHGTTRWSASGGGRDDIDAAPSRRPRSASLSAEGLSSSTAPSRTRTLRGSSTSTPSYYSTMASSSATPGSPSSESVFAAADKFAGGFPW